MISGTQNLDALLQHLRRWTKQPAKRLLARIRTVTQGAGAAGLGIGDRTELKEFHPQENDIESHGATHAILTRLPGDDALKGLFQSRQHLEPHGLGSYRLFSYPSDEFDSGLHALTAEAR